MSGLMTYVKVTYEAEEADMFLFKTMLDIFRQDSTVCDKGLICVSLHIFSDGGN